MDSEDLVEKEYAVAYRTAIDIKQHLPTLRRYAGGLTHVTEFGVRDGMSSRAFIAGRPSVLRMYDNRKKDIPKSLRALMDFVNAEGMDVKYYNVDVLSMSAITPTDLLFIDTLHNCDQLEKELALHAGQVREYIILHDTVTYGFRGQKGKPGLLKALGEFLLKHFEWRVLAHSIGDNGLTTLVRNEAITTMTVEAAYVRFATAIGWKSFGPRKRRFFRRWFAPLVKRK